MWLSFHRQQNSVLFALSPTSLLSTFPSNAIVTSSSHLCLSELHESRLCKCSCAHFEITAQEYLFFCTCLYKSVFEKIKGLGFQRKECERREILQRQQQQQPSSQATVSLLQKPQGVFAVKTGNFQKQGIDCYYAEFFQRALLKFLPFLQITAYCTAQSAYILQKNLGKLEVCQYIKCNGHAVIAQRNIETICNVKKKAVK